MNDHRRTPPYEGLPRVRLCPQEVPAQHQFDAWLQATASTFGSSPMGETSNVRAPMFSWPLDSPQGRLLAGAMRILWWELPGIPRSDVVAVPDGSVSGIPTDGSIGCQEDIQHLRSWLGACPRMDDLLRKSPFGQISRSFSLNMANIRLK